MAEHAGSGACIRFVDEREFKEVSVVDKRRLRKNRPSRFVLELTVWKVQAKVQARTTKLTAAVNSRSRAMRPKPKLKGAVALEKSQKTKEAKVKGQVE